jgi:hypothetical protein
MEDKPIDLNQIAAIRRTFPQLFAEELFSVQPININFKELLDSMSGPYIFKCSCGKILIETSDFLDETKITCECGKIWELKPVDEITRLMWTWKEKN